MLAISACVTLGQSENPKIETDPEKDKNPPAVQTKRFQPVRDKTVDREPRETRLDASLFVNIADDQKRIWLSPTRVRVRDLDWLVPAAGVTAGLFATDQGFNSRLMIAPKDRKKYANYSDYGVIGMTGVAASLYLLGKISGDAQRKEAGLLSGEAAANSLGVTYGLKYATGRTRPLSGNGAGGVFAMGDSFPSAHAAVAWSIASVLAHEYPGPLTKVLVYGAATAISAARIRAKEHFPSDVVVGAGMGWLIGDLVYRRHHRIEFGGGGWGTLPGMENNEERLPTAMGSPYVPLDSWVYPQFDRLIALGYVDSAIVGMRPWTRLECARLLAEAADKLEEGDGNINGNVLRGLIREFARETTLLGGGSNRWMQLESVYTRVTEISGLPLADGAHFGETFSNDFGRPYREGFNNVTGLSAWMTEGRWVVYVRGEYQHAPSWRGYSAAVQNEIAFLDQNPVAPAGPGTARNQVRLLDAYVGLNIGNWQLSYGQQSQWWGPGTSGPMLFSNNASPIRMFHVDRVSPFALPGFMKYLGPMRWNAFFGDLQGTRFSPGPIFHGEKISFKPTPNLEFGFTRTVVFAGQDRALTLNRLFRSYFSVTSSVNETAATDPGKRTGGFDFQYRAPFVRKWLTFYADTIAADDPSPLANPVRAGFSPGIYLPQLPGIPNVDLRVEAANTSVEQVQFTNGHFIYWDGRYHQVYTNRGNLMGSPVGLDGKEILASSRIWFREKDSVQFNYRHVKVDARYIPSGGTINDGSVRVNYWIRGWETIAMVQAERWNFPLLAPGAQTNISGSFQITYWPQHHPRETSDDTK